MKVFLFFLIMSALLLSCFPRKASIDQSTIDHAAAKAALIQELAEFSIDFTRHHSTHTFRTDTLTDRAIRKRFSQSGYGGVVSVTFTSNRTEVLSGIPDSTVSFKQINFSGTSEIWYDFAVVEKTQLRDTTVGSQYVFRKACPRIYYRRTPVPVM